MASSNLNSGKTPEYEDGTIDQCVNPIGDLAVGDEGEVALGFLQVVLRARIGRVVGKAVRKRVRGANAHANDDPCGDHWEPAIDATGLSLRGLNSELEGRRTSR